MAVMESTEGVQPEKPEQRWAWLRFIARDKKALVGMIALAILTLAAILAPYMSSVLDVSADLSELTNSNKTRIEIDVTSSFQVVDDSNPYFLIGSKYVDEIMEGRFHDTVLVLGGCSTLSSPTLAKSLINRGASSVIGWDSLVGSVSNDNTMLKFLENHLINEMEIKNAVQLAMNQVPKGSKYNANFSYYE